MCKCPSQDVGTSFKEGTGLFPESVHYFSHEAKDENKKKKGEEEEMEVYPYKPFSLFFLLNIAK